MTSNFRSNHAQAASGLFEDLGAFQTDRPIVEINGDEGTGKSALLQHLAIKALLPKQHGGSGVGVIYFDLDYHFELPQFVATIEQRTKASEDEIKSWLRNLFLVRCDTAEELVVTLHSIEPMVANSEPPVTLLVLDSITCFHWIESQKGGKSQYLREVNINKVVEILKVFQDKYKMCIAAACQHLLNPEQKQSDGKTADPKDCFKPFLSRQWQEFVGLRFVLTKCFGKDKIVYNAQKIGGLFQRNFAIGCGGVQFIS